MNPLDGLWHVLGVMSPVLVTGCMAALLAKGVWHRDLAATKLVGMCVSATAFGALGFAIATVLADRDGQMSAYAALALGCACGVWLSLLRSRSR